jgi:peptidoglycan hydrolase CwlO-like protein
MALSIGQIIASIKSAIAQNGEYTLTPAAIDLLPIQSLFSLLELEQIQFNRIINESENQIDIAGRSALLGGDSVQVELSFGEFSEGIGASFSVKEMPLCQVPGAPWLSLEQGQIAFHLAGAAQTVSGTLTGTIHAGNATIANAVFEVAKQDSEVVLHWSIAELDLTTIAAVFLDGTALPTELPVFHYKDIAATLVPQTGAFSFEISSDSAIAFPANGETLATSQAHLSIDRSDRTSATHCNVALSSTIGKDIVEGLHIDGFQLDFEYQGGDWSVGGEVQAVVLDAAVTLAASYQQTAAGKTFKLQADVEMAAVSLGDIGSLQLAGIDLELVKPAAEVGQVTELEWSIAAAGAIAIPNVLHSDGTLTIFRQEQAAGLKFEPTTATVQIHLPPDDQAILELDFAGISLIRSGDAAARQWTFDAAVVLSFQNFAPAVQPHLPQKVAMHLIANRQGVTLAVQGDIAQVEYAIPPVQLSGSDRLELGTAAIAITELDIKLGQEISLNATLGIGLPSELNTVFGRKKTADGQVELDADGHPVAALEFFRTFDPQHSADSLVEVKLSISKAGISVAPQTSFIKAIAQQQNAEGESVWHGDFGDFGVIDVLVPTFSYNGASFAGSGGFDVIEPLALPLTPIKQLLEAVKLQGAADALPDALKLDQEINATNFVDKVTEKLTALIAKLGAGSVTTEVIQVIDAIAQAFHKLPTAFTDYLNIQPPQSFKFDVAISPDGTVKFDAAVKAGDPAIKLLFPGLMLGLPVLNGVTLRSISFGLTAGGNLFLLKVDADVDQFDLASMAIALGLAELPTNPLPNSRAMHRRLKLHHLVAVMPVEIPVPIPLFYDNIGIEYLGLEDLLLEAHAQFPMPSPSFKTVGQVLANIKGFFTDPAFKLPDTPPEGFSPDLFSLKQNFLQLPGYMGGETLGDRVGGPTLTYADIAHLLNGIKTLSVNELIQALPLAQRVGSTQVDFGPVSGGLGWLVTTPDEFGTLATQQKQLTYAKLNLANDAQAATLFSVLPKTTTSQPEQGMVIFLRGNAAINNVASFETVFGLVASGSAGFTTGFQMRGDISSVMAMSMAGLVKVNGKQTPVVNLAGRSTIKLASQVNPVFEGDVQISDRRFQCSGSLDIFSVGGTVQMMIDRDRGATMRGFLNPINLTVGTLSLFKLNSATVDVAILPNQLPTLVAQADVELLGIRNQTAIALSDAGFSFTTGGSLFGVFDGKIEASGRRINSTNNVDLGQFKVKVSMQSLPVVPAPLSPATQQQIATLQQQATQLRGQIDRLQFQIFQLQRSPAGRVQIPALQRQLADLTDQLQPVNTRLAQLNPPPASSPKDFKQTLKQEVTQSINAAIAKAKADLSAAQSQVDAAKSKVADLNRQIDAARQTVREKLVQGDAGVRSAQAELNRAKAKVNALNAEIANFQGQIDRASTLDKIKLGITLGPRIAANKIALETAIPLIDVAQKALDKAFSLARSAITTVMVDADPAVKILVQDPAFKLLDASVAFLEGLKKTSAAILQAGDYVSQKGLDALVLVQSASFETVLTTAATGKITMSIQLSYMDKPSSFSGSFDFKDGNSVKVLGQAIAKSFLP